MKTVGSKTQAKGVMWLHAMRVALIATAFSILLVIVFAFVLQKQWLVMSSISIINPIIKVAAALAAAFITIRKCQRLCWLWGMIGGVFYMLLTFTVFSLLSGSFSFSTGTLTDIAMCAASGVAAGVLKNIKG